MATYRYWRSAAGKPVGEFEQDVFPAELGDIAARRRVLGQPAPPLEGGPDVDKELIGLALSGGGIRSATFSLGAIQALAHCGVFKAFDYLSTVSGGGFIGGCLSSLMNDPAVRSDDASFPLGADRVPAEQHGVGRTAAGAEPFDSVDSGERRGTEERPAARHVRNSGNYLAPGGFLDRIRIVAIFIRGLVMNAMTLVPLLLAATLLTQVYYDWDRDRRAPIVLALIAGALFVLTEVTTQRYRGLMKWAERNLVEGFFSISLLIALVAVSTPWFLKVLDLARDQSPSLLYSQLTHFAANPDWRVFAVAAVFAALAAAAQFSATAAKVRSTLLLYAIGLSGPIVVFGAYLLMCILLIEPKWLDTTASVLDPRSSAEALQDLKHGILPTALVDLSPTQPIAGRLQLVDGRPMFEATERFLGADGGRDVADALDNREIPEELMKDLFHNGQDVDFFSEDTNIEDLDSDPDTGARQWHLWTVDADGFVVTITQPGVLKIFWDPPAVTRRRLDEIKGELQVVDGRPMFEAAAFHVDPAEGRNVAKSLDGRTVPAELREARFLNGQDVDSLDDNTAFEDLADDSYSRARQWRLWSPDGDAFVITLDDHELRMFFDPYSSQSTDSQRTDSQAIWGEDLMLSAKFGRLAHLEAVEGATPPLWKLTSAGRVFDIREIYGRVVVSWDLGADLERGEVTDVVRSAFSSKGGLPANSEVEHTPLSNSKGIWFLSAPTSAAVPAGQAVPATVASLRPLRSSPGHDDHKDKDNEPITTIRRDPATGRYSADIHVGILRSHKFLLVLIGTIWWYLTVNVFLLNVGASAFHGFYRDRLSKAYLIKIRRAGDDTAHVSRMARLRQFLRYVNPLYLVATLRAEPGESDSLAPNDHQRLAELNQDGTCAPYHLINAALNLNGVADPDMRGRQSDFFIFSKRFTGGERTLYCRTEDMEHRHSHLNLGTALAISGGAASPNAGSATVRPLVFLLTLLNIRLGYWLPHPARLSQPWWRRRRGAGSTYLLREATGSLKSGTPFINVSDGGHIENLAIYQLLRRRCKVIVAIDAGQDHSLRFEDLMRLVVYARIDLGAEIDIDLEPIRPRASGDGHSRSHFALGRIHYGGDQCGWLLYVKATMTGDEDALLRDYKASHPQFPHQSTAEQFFDERRFEMYRALGFHSLIETFDTLEDDENRGKTLETDSLEGRTRPDWCADAVKEVLVLLLGPRTLNSGSSRKAEPVHREFGALVQAEAL
jgi:hypothetical protein